jgi:hypothetical protein
VQTKALKELVLKAQSKFLDLAAQNVTAEIEAPALQATPACGSGVEGYAPDQMWANKAIACFQPYQGTAGGNPDIVLFQSWELHPPRCLPETDPTTLTGVFEEYLAATGF